MTGLRIQENLFTQETDSDHWRFEVRTVSERNGLTDSLPATLDIFHDKQKGSQTTDFVCRLRLIAAMAGFLFHLFARRSVKWRRCLCTAELVKDFKCLFEVNKLNCSWIPANPSLNLTVSYR